MADIPGLDADVYFGATTKPLPDWRAGLNVRADEDAEDEPLSDADRKSLVAVLGFDPAELGDDATPVRDDKPVPFSLSYGKPTREFTGTAAERFADLQRRHGTEAVRQAVAAWEAAAPAEPKTTALSLTNYLKTQLDKP